MKKILFLSVLFAFFISCKNNNESENVTEEQDNQTTEISNDKKIEVDFEMISDETPMRTLKFSHQ